MIVLVFTKNDCVDVQVPGLN